MAAGCAGRQKYAATVQHVQPGEEAPLKLTLSPAEQTEVRRILRSVAEGEEPVNPPAAAPRGMRFIDVPNAVRAACAEVEMAVVSTQRIEKGGGGGGGYKFALKTIEDWPAELVVMRTDDDRIYQATATVGRFEDRVARAERLLDALQKQMRAFGAKPRFNRDNP
ncbi:MAG: hypothetical protein JSV91_03780 [Phycisphaerales bacterium]|nr:MAG: hypothetical protein JSV91_03780 [Phycisphaerales bacterium]